MIIRCGGRAIVKEAREWVEVEGADTVVGQGLAASAVRFHSFCFLFSQSI